MMSTAACLLSERDSTQIIQLINLIQPSTPWTEERFHWQYLSTPSGTAKLYGIKNENGDLISFYAGVSHQIRIGDRIIPARMVQDVMTHPDYRGRGYLHHLGQRCLEDIVSSGEVGYTFPNDKSENSFRRLGWHELCQVPLRKKSVKPDGSIDCRFLSLSNYTDLWESTRFPVGVHRNAVYLNWRYSKPGVAYFKFIPESGDGLLILKVYYGLDARLVHICELFTASDRLDLVVEMLRFSELFAADRGADQITAWLPAGHPYEPAFNDAGLALSDSGRYVFVHPGSTALNEITQANLWHLTQGDSDIY